MSHELKMHKKKERQERVKLAKTTFSYKKNI